jgi:hypothetical protein
MRHPVTGQRMSAFSQHEDPFEPIAVSDDAPASDEPPVSDEAQLISDEADVGSEVQSSGEDSNDALYEDDTPRRAKRVRFSTGDDGDDGDDVGYGDDDPPPRRRKRAGTFCDAQYVALIFPFRDDVPQVPEIVGVLDELTDHDHGLYAESDPDFPDHFHHYNTVVGTRNDLVQLDPLVPVRAFIKQA